MSLNWTLSEGQNPFVSDDPHAAEHRFHHAESAAVEDSAVANDIDAALAKAVSFLNANVKNESRYFLVEWDPSSSTLRLAVTDDRKQQDAADVVSCRFMALNQQLQAQGAEAVEQCSEKVQFWLKDYLSSCAAFMDYSLVAVFTDGARDRVRML
jgi:hypothetical protein